VTRLFVSVVINGSTNSVLRFACHVYLAKPNKSYKKSGDFYVILGKVPKALSGFHSFSGCPELLVETKVVLSLTNKEQMT
jgi:hypothetical protein